MMVMALQKKLLSKQGSMQRSSLYMKMPAGRDVFCPKSLSLHKFEFVDYSETLEQSKSLFDKKKQTKKTITILYDDTAATTDYSVSAWPIYMYS